MHNICNLKYSVPKNIPIAFHNGSNYDYHFIIKELTEEFKKQFTYLGENTGKYITFTVTIEKRVTRINENGEKITKNTSYILQFIDSARFMASSLSNLANNLSGRIHKIKYKYGHNDKKYETCRIKYKYCHCFLEYTNFKDDLIKYKCLCCNKNYQQKFDEKLMEDIIDADYPHIERVCRDYEIKILREYHDLYVQSDTLLLPDVFENFRNLCF